MPNSTHTDVAQNENSHALRRMLDDGDFSASSAPPTTGASPDAQDSVDMTAPMGAFDLWQSSAPSMLPDVPVPTMDGGGFYITSDEPMDLMASYDANGNIYRGWASAFTVAGRHSDGQDLGMDPELNLGYPHGELFEDAAWGLTVADDQSDDVDQDWVMLPTQADGEEMVEYPPADAPGYSMTSYVLSAALIIGAGFGWGSDAAQ